MSYTFLSLFRYTTVLLLCLSAFAKGAGPLREWWLDVETFSPRSGKLNMRLLQIDIPSATYTWDGGLSHGNNTPDGNWSTVNNWAGGSAPLQGASTDLIFSQSGVRRTANQNIGSSFQLRSITFDNISNVTDLTGGTLDFDTGSPSIRGQATQNSAIAVTISNNIILDRGLTVGGTGSAALTFSGTLSGSGSLWKQDSGTLILAGSSNSFLGGIELNGGILEYGNGNALGSGAITLAGGELRATSSTTLARSISLGAGQQGAISVVSGSTLTFTGAINALGDLSIGSGQEGSGGVVIFSPSSAITSFNTTLTITGGAVRAGNPLLGLLTSSLASVTIAATAQLDFQFQGGSPTIANLQGAGSIHTESLLTLLAGDYAGTVFGGGGVTKSSAGALTLSGSSQFEGNFTLDAGDLRVGHNRALGGAQVTLVLAGGNLSAVNADRVLDNPVTVIGNAVIASSPDSTPRRLTFSGTTSLNSGTLLNVSNIGDTTFSNVISGSGGIVKSGVGRLILSNTANTFTGGLTLNGGTLALPNEGIFGLGSVALNAGRLEFQNSLTTARTYNLSNAMTIASAAGTTLSYGDGANINGGFLGTGGLHAFRNGSSMNGATSAFGSSLTTTGSVAFSNATLRGAATQLSGTLTATNTLLSSAGTLAVSGVVSTNGFESDGILTVNAGGTVANSGTPLVLGGGSRTTINSGGTLATGVGSTIELNDGVLTNNGTQSGVLNVNFGSLAKGIGLFGTVNVNEGGRFAPGNSPGVATVANLSLAGGGSYQFELNTTAVSPGAGQDFINAANNISITAGATSNSVFSIAIVSLNTINQPGALSDFDATQNYNFTLATAAGGITGFAPNKFSVDTSAFANNLQGGHFEVAQIGNDLQLRFVAVPEPSTWAMMLAGVTLLVGFSSLRCRRRN